MDVQLTPCGTERQGVASTQRALVIEFRVGQGIETYTALRGNAAVYMPIIKRCKGLMRSVDCWNTVESCADQDIEAERALEEY